MAGSEEDIAERILTLPGISFPSQISDYLSSKTSCKMAYYFFAKQLLKWSFGHFT